MVQLRDRRNFKPAMRTSTQRNNSTMRGYTVSLPKPVGNDRSKGLPVASIWRWFDRM